MLLRFPCPMAPRLPGQRTSTPEHASILGTHVGHEPCASASRLHVVVRPRHLGGRRGSGTADLLTPPDCHCSSLGRGAMPSGFRLSAPSSEAWRMAAQL